MSYSSGIHYYALFEFEQFMSACYKKPSQYSYWLCRCQIQPGIFMIQRYHLPLSLKGWSVVKLWPCKNNQLIHKEKRRGGGGGEDQRIKHWYFTGIGSLFFISVSSSEDIFHTAWNRLDTNRFLNDFNLDCTSGCYLNYHMDSYWLLTQYFFFYLYLMSGHHSWYKMCITI